MEISISKEIIIFSLIIEFHYKNMLTKYSRIYPIVEKQPSVGQLIEFPCRAKELAQY